MTPLRAALPALTLFCLAGAQPEASAQQSGVDHGVISHAASRQRVYLVTNDFKRPAHDAEYAWQHQPERDDPDGEQAEGDDRLQEHDQRARGHGDVFCKAEYDV